MQRTIVALALAGGCVAVLGSVEALRDTVWAGPIGATATVRLSRLTGVVPTSLAENIEAAFGLWVAYTLVQIAWAGLRRKGTEAVRAASRLAGAGAASALTFYLLWGLHYADAPLADRLSWCAENPSEHELLALGEALVDRANAAWREAQAVPADPAERDVAIDVGLERALVALGMPSHHLPARGPAKPLRLGGPLVASLGISGFYFPFTGEANVVPGQPAWYEAVVTAHEKAHQRGIASEDEANFVGFLGAIHSPDPLVRYGGWLFAQRQALTAVQRTLPGPVQHAVRSRLPAVQQDVLDLRAFWQRYEGPGRKVGEALNDSYLRLHRVPGGTASYGASVRLIAAWTRGGACPADRQTSMTSAAPP